MTVTILVLFALTHWPAHWSYIVVAVYYSTDYDMHTGHILLLQCITQQIMTSTLVIYCCCSVLLNRL